MASVRDDAARIAAQFIAARRAADGFADYPGEMPDSLEGAYRIQDSAIEAWGKPVLGWKIGRIIGTHAERYGIDRLAGPIFSIVDDSPGSAAEMPVYAKGFAAGEAEYLLRIGSQPAAGKLSFSLHETLDLIDAVHAGIEIASSPLKTINELGPIAVVSDFGNNNGLLIGPEIADWQTSGFEQWPVVSLIDGVEAGHGMASAFPDGAIGSARFLFELMAQRGISLSAGQWISTGAITGVHDARPGQTVEAWFGDEHHLACRLVAEKGA